MKKTISGFKVFMSRQRAMHKRIFIFLILLMAIFPCRSLFASEDKTKNATTQQVGGLLFDVDEGVKIEHGPGGSVYLKSNREYMQDKFKGVDEKMEALEKRLDSLEKAFAAEKKNNPVAVAEAEGASPAPASNNGGSGKRVLVT